LTIFKLGHWQLMSSFPLNGRLGIDLPGFRRVQNLLLNLEEDCNEV